MEKKLIRRFAFLLLLVLVGIFSGCKGSFCDRNPTDPSCIGPAIERMEEIRVTGRQQLAEFRPVQAYDLWEELYALEVSAGLDHCESSYGKYLASGQLFVHKLNSLILSLIPNIVGLAPTSGPPQLDSSDGWRALAEFVKESDFEKGPNDLGIQLTQGFDELSKPLDAMLAEMEVIGEDANCEFFMGPQNAVDVTSTEAWQEVAGYPNYLPLRLVSNKKEEIGDDSLMVELRLGDRWDAVEARSFSAVAGLITAVFHFLSAHRLDMSLDVYQLTNALGINLKYWIECTTDPSVWVETPIPDSYDCDDNGVLNLEEECLGYFTSINLYLPQVMRRLGFLFGDNPGFFAQHQTRWTEYFPDIDNRYADMVENLRLVFDAMVARAGRVDNRDDELDRFFVYYKDTNEDGKVGQGDQIGFTLSEIKVYLSPPVLEALGMTQADLDNLLEQVIPLIEGLIRTQINSDLIVDDTKKLLEQAHDNLLSVDDPSVNFTPIAVKDIQGILVSTGFFDEIAIPDVLAVDLGAYYKEPKALRDFMPYWEAVPDPEATARNEWVIETESTEGGFELYERYFNAPGTTPGSEVEKLQHWEFAGDVSHFSRSNFTINDDTTGARKCAGQYVGFNPYTNNVHSSDAYQCVGPLTLRQPVDCVGPLASGESDFDVLSYTYFQDPSFNNSILTKTSTIDRPNDVKYDNFACFDPSRNHSTYLPANNWTFHRSVFRLVEWFYEANKIIPLIQGLVGADSGSGKPGYCPAD